jgi:hypothetical protein
LRSLFHLHMMNSCQAWPRRSIFSAIVVTLNNLPEFQRAFHTSINIPLAAKAPMWASRTRSSHALPIGLLGSEHYLPIS